MENGDVRLLCEITVPKRVMLEFNMKSWPELNGGAEIFINNGHPSKVRWTTKVIFLRALVDDARPH
jgi:hypothetical protein